MKRWLTRSFLQLLTVSVSTAIATIATSLIATPSLAATSSAAKTFVQCKGRQYMVTFRQWDTLLTLRDSSGVARSIPLMMSAQADLGPSKALTYEVDTANPATPRNASFKVVKYRIGKPQRVNGRTIVRTAVNIQDGEGRQLFEAKIPCFGYRSSVQ